MFNAGAVCFVLSVWVMCVCLVCVLSVCACVCVSVCFSACLVLRALCLLRSLCVCVGCHACALALVCVFYTSDAVGEFLCLGVVWRGISDIFIDHLLL